LYERLASRHADRIDWPRVHFFWADERCVADGDPESNYQLAHEALLSRVPVVPANVHRVRGEHPDPHGAAIEYDRMLKRYFSFSASGEARPFDGMGRAADETPAGLQKDRAATAARTTFDVVLLGLGQDGHTASLFPGDPILGEARHWVYAVKAPKGVVPRDRITLTLPALSAAARAIFLVTGDRKRDILEMIRENPERAAALPAARVTPSRGVLWLADRAAAGLPSA
jgi:6-phosphogluconolactonase